MKVGLLTTSQAEQIKGKEYAPDSLFNPIQDKNDNWVISEQEMNCCNVEEFIWVKDLLLIEYEPKPTPPFSPINFTE